MKKKKELSNYKKRILLLLIGSIVATGAMMTGMLVMAKGAMGEYEQLPGYSVASLSLLGISVIIRFFEKPDEPYRFRYFIFGFLYIASGVLSLFVNSNSYVISMIIGLTISFILILERVFRLIKKHDLRSIIVNIIGILISIFIGVVFVTTGEQYSFALPLFYGFLVTLFSFINVMVYIFAGIKKNVLLKIIQKTYAIEIIYGLLILIVAISFLLYSVEEKFVNIGDALWYCFAVVTTIGFGDFTATTLFGRILTVVLGLYGIVVTALITSIIVNFYNEVRPGEEEKDSSKKDKK